MHEQLWHQFEHEFLFNGYIMFDVIMEDFQALEYLWMVVDLLKYSVFNLVVLDDTQNTNFLDSLYKNFFLEVALIVKLSHEVGTVFFELLKHLSLGLFLLIQGRKLLLSEVIPVNPFVECQNIGHPKRFKIMGRIKLFEPLLFLLISLRLPDLKLFGQIDVLVFPNFL